MYPGRTAMGRAILILGCSVILASCGGGGGGSSPSPPIDPGDGLGVSGQAANTTRAATVTNGTNTRVVVTLDDVGRALAVWLDGNTLSWTRKTQNGPWDGPRTLPQAISAGEPALRGLPSGDAALAWSGGGATRLLRYTPTTTWDVAATTVPLASPTLKNRSDFTLFPDGTVALSREGAATNPPDPAKNSAFHVLRHTVPSGWTTPLETPPFQSRGSSSLAANEDGSATFFWVEGQQNAGATAWSLRAQTFDVFAGVSFAPLTIPTNNYILCNDLMPVSAAASPSPTTSRVVGIVYAGSVPSTCNFDLVRFDIFTNSSNAQRMNTAGTTLAHPPFVMMSRAGDALAVWSEEPIAGGSLRAMWSQSLQGGAWSTPAPIINEEAHFGTLGLALAMNSSGQVAAALITLTNNRQYIKIGRFSFASGWSTWQPVANTSSMSLPAVAINTQGQALVVYGATPCERRPDPSSFGNCTAPGIYTFAF